MNKLTQTDLRVLEQCFITSKIAEAAGLRRVTDEEGAAMTGQKRTADRNFAGIAFPYFLPPDYSNPHSYNLRRDNPDIVRDGTEQKEERKYLKSPGSRQSLYFPPNVTDEMLSNISLPVVICEGEKKTLALYRLATLGLRPGESWRFLPVGISGVFNWRGKIGKTTKANGQAVWVKGLITDFQKLELSHRQTTILFDSNVQTNAMVRIARHQIAETLQAEKQAMIYFADLPQMAGINGIDDLLGLWERETGTNEAIKNGLNLLDSKYFFTGELRSVLLDGKLTLCLEPADRGKSKVSAKDVKGEPLAMDVCNLAEAEKRVKFIKQIEAALPLTDEDKTEVQRELISLAALRDALGEEAKTEAPTGETVQTTFQELKDSRIIEQIRTGFAVYETSTGEYSIADTVTDSDGTIYLPVEDELFQKPGGVQIADALDDYGRESELVKDIEIYLSKYIDLKPLYLKITALYILFTYLFDKVLELSYLNATGDAGSGKSRFGQAVCLASHRGLSLITPSAASLYRTVDKFQPTLFLDEFNSDVNSDDAAAIIQVLNAGFQQTAQIPRQVATGDGNFQTQMFDAFCPKIIGSLKQSGSNAFNSRCIEIQMERTSRNDIPLRLSHKLLNDAQALRNKLTLWRLRNFRNDFEGKLDRAETELRQAGIMPRSIQINIPLFALIEDKNLKREFITLLKGRDESLNEEKRNSFDGELTQMLHNILFDVQEDGTAEWKISMPADGLLCEDLRVEKIVSMLNDSRNQKDELNVRYVGKKIHSLGLRSDQILRRKSDYHKKTAVYFDSHKLKIIFTNFGLPIPADFSLDQLDQNDNLNKDNDLDWSKESLGENAGQPSLDQVNFNNSNNNGDWSNWSKENSEKGREEENIPVIDQTEIKIMAVDEVI